MKRLIPAVVLLLTAAPLPAADYPFQVKVVGQGKPMILIPGLGCSGEVWDSTVAHFKDRYECHVLTLAGFAGQKPVEGPFAETMLKGIRRYVRDKKLEKPAVVGHSLGGFLVFRLGATEPDLFGPLIAVDGFPHALGLFMPEATAEQRKEFADGFRAKLADAPREEFLKTLQEMFGQWLKGEQLQTVSKWLADSDQQTIGKAMGELFTADAREGLEKVKSPVLLLGAYDVSLVKYIPTKEEFVKRLEGQVETIKGAKVAVRDNCKHFIMYDEPKWMFEQMEAVLGKK